MSYAESSVMAQVKDILMGHAALDTLTTQAAGTIITVVSCHTHHTRYVTAHLGVAENGRKIVFFISTVLPRPFCTSRDSCVHGDLCLQCFGMHLGRTTR